MLQTDSSSLVLSRAYKGFIPELVCSVVGSMSLVRLFVSLENHARKTITSSWNAVSDLSTTRTSPCHDRFVLNFEPEIAGVKIELVPPPELWQTYSSKV